MIVCLCRGKSDRDVMAAIEDGASTIRDLQRCGIGDQCGSCHVSLRVMLAEAAAAAAPLASEPHPSPVVDQPLPALATA